MDNGGHEFQHITPCYSIILQRFKYQFGQNFVILTFITSGIRDFTVALVLRLRWESLPCLQRNILVKKTYPCYTLKRWRYRTIQDLTFNLKII